MTGAPRGPVTYAFVPAATLKPDTVYRLVVDEDYLVGRHGLSVDLPLTMF